MTGISTENVIRCVLAESALRYMEGEGRPSLLTYDNRKALEEIIATATEELYARYGTILKIEYAGDIIKIESLVPTDEGRLRAAIECYLKFRVMSIAYGGGEYESAENEALDRVGMIPVKGQCCVRSSW